MEQIWVRPRPGARLRGLTRKSGFGPGELAKLGWRVSPRTVAKYRPRHLERGRGQRWRTFLQNHASQVWACDFFTVVTVHFQTLFAFVVTSFERRRIVHVGVTSHPTGAWVAQRTSKLSATRHRAICCTTATASTRHVSVLGSRPRGAMPSVAAQSADGECDLRAPRGDAPSRLSRPRSTLHRAHADPSRRGRGRSCGCRRAAPKLNAYAERFVRSIKQECLRHLVPLGERHLRTVIRERRGPRLRPGAIEFWYTTGFAPASALLESKTERS